MSEFVTALDTLSDRCGIARNYRDFRGDWTEISPAARIGVLSAMGFDTSETGAGEVLASLDREETRALPHTLLIRSDSPVTVTLKLPEEVIEEGWRLQILREDGFVEALELPSLHASPVCEVAGRALRCADLSLRHGSPIGYHQLQLVVADR